MPDQLPQTFAIVIYFAAMIAIGLHANSRTKNLDDYMLGGRNLKPGVAALSAGASDMSGWLLLGLPGAVFLSGLVEAWIAVGLVIGAWVNWKFIAPRLRSYTEVSHNSITIPSFLDNRLKGGTRLLRIASGLIILVFFTFYVSSGMVAGGLFFQSSFGSTYHAGLLLVVGVTIAYTLFGGFLGATYTDVAQGLLMFVALVMVPVVGIINVGGFGQMAESIRAVQPDALSMVSGATAIGVISALAWGLGYFGQPHIIVRFMAMRSPSDAKTGRRIGMAWMVLSVIGAIATALVGVAYYGNRPDESPTDPESVFLDLAQLFFHPLVAGFVLAAVLAAIMSTVSSQLIVSSSALVEDLYKLTVKQSPSERKQVWMGRAGVADVALVAVFLAWEQNNTILGLVAFAWAGFGASFGPIVILSLFWRRLTDLGAITGMVLGAVTVFVWTVTPWADLYEIIPGFIVSLVSAVLVSQATYRRDEDVEREFDDAVRLTHAAQDEMAAR
ncbi:sodium/proline symporter PutP [Kocuria arenosa]|uniref:sodium/proline symporter PutP n=1 Tax=Kocuria arenosa TaxID=3071446 RepID=UPI0034D6BEE3